MPRLRRSAAFALGRIGDDALPAVPALIRRLRDDSDAGVRDMAASAIGDIARASKGGAREMWTEVVRPLLHALKTDTDAHVRRSAAYALGAFGSLAAGAVDVLSAALRDEAPSVRQNAAWALGQIGRTGR